LQVKSDVDEVSFVLCHNTLMGKQAKDACANTCIGCRRCVKVCPKKCITVENNVARIDISECVGCKVCMSVCPEGAIYPLAWVS
jgi:ferredoxin